MFFGGAFEGLLPVANIKRATHITHIRGYHEVRYKTEGPAITLMKRLCAIKSKSGILHAAELRPRVHSCSHDAISGQWRGFIRLESLNRENAVVIYYHAKEGGDRVANAFNGLIGALKKN